MKICFYEGYIRNQKHLCKRLQISAESSRKKTERKLLSAAYKRWGKDIVRHLSGSFAFALWDGEKEEMFCARDPFGVQTFYYHLTGDGELLCSCNISDIVKSKGFKKEIDLQSLQYFLMFGYPVGEKTLYKGIFKLLPGRTLSYRNGQCRIERYFTPVFQPDNSVSEKERVKQIQDTLNTVLDEDKGNFNFSEAQCFLSGGVDSSYLLAASGIKSAGNICFSDKEVSEYKFARDTAEFLGAELKSINISAKDYFAAIPSFLRNTELPLADKSAVAFAAGCKQMAEHTKCCLSGEGADEFFAGYHIYRTVDEPADGRYCGCFGVMTEAAACKLLKTSGNFPADDLVKGIYEKENITDKLNLMLAVDISLWLEGDILLNVGRNTRANGIDVLLPFADRRMFELSAKIPAELKLKDGCGKYIFRKAARELLPEKTAFRAKNGFPVPLKKWLLEEPCRSEIERVLFSETSEKFFDVYELKRRWRYFCDGAVHLYYVIYTVYIFLRWYEEVFNSRSE